jgi:hypothetical protein
MPHAPVKKVLKIPKNSPYLREKVYNSIFIFRAISLTSVGKPPCFFTLFSSREKGGGGNEIHAPCACEKSPKNS